MTRICVPVCARDLDRMRDAVERAADAADIIELRLDCLDEVEISARDLARLGGGARSLILTLRSAEQGGHTSLDYDSRRRFWTSLKPSGTDCFFDLEYDLVQEFASAQSSYPFEADWKWVICSHHEFEGIPPNLHGIYEAMAATRAGILKIAVQAKDITDCLPILKLLERAQNERRELIAIAMGPAGITTRVLGLSRGSVLTYGSLDDESGTAPGQITANQLRNLYRIGGINSQAEIFGIVGNPLGQSLSPHIHNSAFAAANLNAVYLPFQITDVTQFIKRMVHPKTRELQWNLVGLSVTIPDKSAVMTLLDWIDPTAKEIGAVNTIVVQNNRLLGYNTDAQGFIAPLRDRFGSVKNARCAVIGAGGGARAALWALTNHGANVSLFARNIERAAFTASDFGVSYGQLANADFTKFDIVVNATPLGMSGANQEMTPVSAAQLRGVRLAYDLVYNPLQTRFLRVARDAGCETLGGMEMLLSQAVEQFKLWTGREPDLGVMRMQALTQVHRAIKDGQRAA